VGVVSHFYGWTFERAYHGFRYCEESKSKDPRMNDPTEFLKIAKPNDFKGYLEWRKDNSGITRQQIMYTRWCTLSMVYQHTAKRYMSEEVLSDTFVMLVVPLAPFTARLTSAVVATQTGARQFGPGEGSAVYQRLVRPPTRRLGTR
jgi:hypothetical protein